jgi:DNA-binding response OmpR family regulator
MKILIVDDDVMVLESLKHNLSHQGYDCITASDGVQALSMARVYGPDLIISDVMMPGFSGLDLLSMLKQFYLSNVPVIIISSHDKSDIIRSSMGLGAAYFVPKPIDFKELNGIVKQYQA